MDDEIKPLLLELLRRTDQIIDTQRDHGDRLTRVEDRLTRVEDRLTRVEGRLTRVEGRLTEVESGLVEVKSTQVIHSADLKRLDNGQSRLEGQGQVLISWLQSMDQRFGALMTPFVPPGNAGQRKAG